MDMRQAMDLVINFFTDIINKVFSIEFFDGVEFGKIALFVLATSLLLDILLEIMGRGKMSEGDDSTPSTEDRLVAENHARIHKNAVDYQKRKAKAEKYASRLAKKTNPKIDV